MLTDVRSRGLYSPPSFSYLFFSFFFFFCAHKHITHHPPWPSASAPIFEQFNYEILYKFCFMVFLCLSVSISSSIYVPSFSCHWIVQIENCNLFSFLLRHKNRVKLSQWSITDYGQEVLMAKKGYVLLW